MFTGIVRELGTVAAASADGEGRSLVIHAPDLATSSAVGDSVSIDGCCLTIETVAGETVSFHAVPETLARTTLGRLRIDDRVNIETAVRAGEPLGGHYVQGHVDAVGRVRSAEAEGAGMRVFVEVPDEVLRTCVEKGSVTIDGVSLTIAELAEDAIAVALVPHTLEATTLSALKPGRDVNVEADVIGKYVDRLLRAQDR